MIRNMPFGISEFREVREDHSFYVDKSNLISEVISNRAKVILLQRPRRFGKTLNLTMLREFFNDQVESRHLFKNLAVQKNSQTMAHLGKYPTIYITFKDLKPDSWEICQERLVTLVKSMFEAHWQRIEASDLPQYSKDLAYQIVAGTPSLATCQDSLKTLTELLQRLSGEKVICLIDEYDSPIHAGYQNDYRNQIVNFMRDFLSGGLKDNPALKKGVLTGILRVAKDSIFSGLNNLRVFTLLEKPFSAHFGFTESEVDAMLEAADMTARKDEVQGWYNGYRFGNQTLYNPWSIISILSDPEGAFQPHWINTANNNLIRDLIVGERAVSLSELTTLLAGDAVERFVDPNVALNDLKPENVWGLMLLSGYLTLAKVQPIQSNRHALCIPNLEVRTFFESTVSHWLGKQTHTDALMRSLLQEDMKQFAELLSETVVQVLSFHDTATSGSERFYHVFLAGLMVNLNHSYLIRSNRESGHGRYDLMLIPKQRKQTAFIFEIKRGEAKRLGELAQTALDQIIQQDYRAVLREYGIERTCQIGLAFDGKRIALASSIYIQNQDPQVPTVTLTVTGQDSEGSLSAVEQAYLRFNLSAWRLARLQRSRGSHEINRYFNPNYYVNMDGMSQNYGRNHIGQIVPNSTHAVSGDGENQELENRLPLTTWLGALRCLVISGSPGSGKTVFMTRVAAQLAAQLLGEDSVGGELQELIPKTGLSPIPVVLEAVRLAGQVRGLAGLAKAVAQELAIGGSSDLPSHELLERQLLQGRFLLMVDALDEVASESQRRELLNQFKGFAALSPKARMLLTTRSARYIGMVEFRPEFEIVEIIPLNQLQVTQFLHQYRLAQSETPEFEQHLTMAITELESRHPDVGGEFSENPLTLTLLSWLYQRDRRLPDDRVGLCSRLVDSMCEARSHPAPNGSALSGNEKRKLLAHLALAMQRASVQSYPVSACLAVIAASLPPGPSNDRSYQEYVLGALVEQTGLISYKSSASGELQIRFSYRFLREYLAALRLSSEDRTMDTLVTDLARDGHLSDPFWFDVVCMLPGVFNSSERANTYVAALLNQAKAANPNDARLWGTLIATLNESRHLYAREDVEGYIREARTRFEVEGSFWSSEARALLLESIEKWGEGV